jgi:hypothetical protein
MDAVERVWTVLTHIGAWCFFYYIYIGWGDISTDMWGVFHVKQHPKEAPYEGGGCQASPTRLLQKEGAVCEAD